IPVTEYIDVTALITAADGSPVRSPHGLAVEHIISSTAVQSVAAQIAEKLIGTVPPDQHVIRRPPAEQIVTIQPRQRDRITRLGPQPIVSTRPGKTRPRGIERCENIGSEIGQSVARVTDIPAGGARKGRANRLQEIEQQLLATRCICNQLGAQ